MAAKTSEGRILILGFGFAGASLSMALVEAGFDPKRLLIVDGGDPAGASRAPATMLHAFPGRTMALRRGQGEFFLRSFRRLREWAGEESSWWTELEMVRPLEGVRGEGLRESWKKERESFPEEIWSELLGPEEVNARFKELSLECEALVYGPAAGVVAPELLKVLRERLQSRGVEFVSSWMERLGKRGARWEARFEDGSQIDAERVVLAVGARLGEYFSGLDLRPRPGELLLLDPGDAKLTVMLNKGKHIFRRPDGLWGLGSTYFDLKDWEERDDQAVIEELLGGLRRELPALAQVRVVELWRGVRGVFGSDHLPLVGEVPGMEGLHLFAGLGSKGLLWAPAVGEDLARALLGEGEEAIREEMRASRVKAGRFVAPSARLGYPAR